MVQAILAGRKSMTRRLLKIQPPASWKPQVGPYHRIIIDRHGEEQPGPESFGVSDEDYGCKLPFAPGDLLWVREAGYLIKHASWYDPVTREDRWDIVGWRYAADDAIADFNGEHPGAYIDDCSETKRPSIHMPRWASRITLRVTDVKVERLQDISEGDAQAEGIYWSEEFEGWTSGRGPDETCDFHGQWATKSFMKLWCSLHGDGAWDSNPWVVAVSFERIPARADAGLAEVRNG